MGPLEIALRRKFKSPEHCLIALGIHPHILNEEVRKLGFDTTGYVADSKLETRYQFEQSPITRNHDKVNSSQGVDKMHSRRARDRLDYDNEEEEMCPHCGQPMPEEDHFEDDKRRYEEDLRHMSSRDAERAYMRRGEDRRRMRSEDRRRVKGRDNFGPQETSTVRELNMADPGQRDYPGQSGPFGTEDRRREADDRRGQRNSHAMDARPGGNFLDWCGASRITLL